METKPKAGFFSLSDDQFNRLIAVLIAIVTVLVAVITYLQNDAAARDDQANRDSKRYSVEAFGRQVSGTARVNFDESVAYQMLYGARLSADVAAANEDDLAAQRYTSLADQIVKFSPLLALPYYDPKGLEGPDIAGYITAAYLREITALQEKYAAAWVVKNAWDYKANTYILYITLLAVVLFLFGLAATLAKTRARWIFVGLGVLIALVAVAGSLALWVTPVQDLRQQGSAIADYSDGVGLAFQGQYDAAVTAFDRALAVYPDYRNALVERAGAQMSLENYQAAVDDYRAAIQLGDQRAFVAGNLGWAAYMQGDFQQAIDANRTGLQTSPDELWIQFDLGLSLLAAGQIEQARTEYSRGMEMASRWVKESVAAGQEPPAFLWWSLYDAALSLDELLSVLDEGNGSPPPATIRNPEMVRTAAQELLTRLKSLVVALEYTNEPPVGTVSARVGALQFAVPLYDSAGEIVGHTDPVTEFEAGVTRIWVQFDFEGFTDGQQYLVKLYVDGEEDPSWRVQGTWDSGTAGSMGILLENDYGDVFAFDPGYYEMEFYVDHHLVQRGSFTVLEQ